MPQQTGYNFDIHLVVEQLADKGVTKNVNAYMGNSGLFQNTIVHPVQISRIDRFPCCIGKHLWKLSVVFM